MANINQLVIAVVDADYLNLDLRDKMFYKEYQNTISVLAEIINLSKQNGYCEREDSEGINFYGVNEFFTELNAEQIDTENCWVIPVFVKEYNVENPAALTDKFACNTPVTNKSYTSRLDEAFDAIQDEMFELIKKNGNKVQFNGIDYTIKNDEIHYKAANEDKFHPYVDTYYGYCETFENIKRVLDDKVTTDEIIDKVLNLTCKHITELMQHIGAWNSYQRVADIADLAELIADANGEGLNVKVELQYGHDYYVYGHSTNKGYEIYGLLDSSDEFMDLLKLQDNALKIAGNKEYKKYLDKLVESEKK